jgi:hypothetical protein
MAVRVTGSVSISINVSDVRDTVTGALKETGNRAVAIAASWSIASGTAAGQADKIWGDTRTPPGGGAGGTDVVDLAAVLTNAYGTVETFVKVKAIVIVASATNTTTLQIARPAAATGAPLFAAISDALAPLSAGGGFAWFDPAAGFTVTPATGDIINVVNSAGASATYDIAVVGTSA